MRMSFDELADFCEARALEGIRNARASRSGKKEQEVAVYFYPTREAFEAAGGEGRYGVGWELHSRLCGETVARLRRRGLKARLTPFTGALEEPTNLHEQSHEERSRRR